MRTFISIDIPEEIKKKIIEIQNKLPGFQGKLTEEENLHLTLKFLGEVDEEQIEKIKEKLKEIKFNKFETEIDSIGVFSENFIKIVWLHMTNCEELQKQIDEKLSDWFEKEDRFMGHLTIARVKNIKDKKEFLEQLGKIKIDKMKFSVCEFKLMKSELEKDGPKYKILEKFK
jgi:2'-5' RNA ligase